MNLFKTWFAAALAFSFGLVGVAQPAMAQVAPAVQKAPALPPLRDFEARQFVRDFESFPPGVDLIKELKITPEQSDKLHVLLGRFGQQPVNDAEAETAAYQQARKDILAVLTTEQRTRLEQIRFQSHLRSSGMTRTITGEPSIERLGLTPEQIEKLKAKETESQKQFELELEAVRQKYREHQRLVLTAARERVLEVLTAAQRTQFEKLAGAPIDIEERTLDYGVAGVSARMRSTGFGSSRGGFGGRGGFSSLPPRLPVPQNKP